MELYQLLFNDSFATTLLLALLSVIFRIIVSTLGQLRYYIILAYDHLALTPTPLITIFSKTMTFKLKLFYILTTIVTHDPRYTYKLN